MYKNILVTILLSFLLAVLWGQLFLNQSVVSHISIILGLVATILFIILFKKKITQTPVTKCLFITFPLIYFCLLLVLSEISIMGKIVSPMMAGVILLMTFVFFVDKVVSVLNVITTLFLSFIYLYAFYPEYKKIISQNDITYFGDITEYTKSDSTSFTKFDLKEYRFLDENLDTINLTSDKFILIETWNETCVPCIRAIKELPEYYENRKDKLVNYYLYENSIKSIREKYDKIFNYKFINNREKILIDIDQKLFKDFKMNGYPYFLLFDKTGKFIDYHLGYSSDHKEIVQNKFDKYLGY